MPDHDLFDLDDAFRALEHDLSTLAPAPGAAAAVSRARRRRRTTFGAVTAAAVVVVGGVAVAQGVGHDDSAVSPITSSTEPAPFDGPHLTAATAGWTPAWTEPSQAVTSKIAQAFGGDCAFGVQGGTAAMVPLGNAHDDVAFAVFSDYGTDTAAQKSGWDKLRSQMESCPQAHSTGDFTSDAGEGIIYRVDSTASETAPQYVWIVSTGQAVAWMKISDQSDPLPEANRGPVTAALLAGAQDPATYAGALPQSGVARIDPTKTLGQVWAPTLEPALAGWSTPWDPALPHSSAPADPPACTDDFVGGYAGPNETVNVGSNGQQWVQWFTNTQDAVEGLQRMQKSLEQCATPYTFHEVTLDNGRPILVGVGPNVFWATRVGTHDLIVSVPAGDTPPPDEVSRQVGTVLEAVLERPAETTVSPDKSTKVPDWMKTEIAAAPTFGP